MKIDEIKLYPEDHKQHQLPEFYPNPNGQCFEFIQLQISALYAKLCRKYWFRQEICLQYCCS